MTSIARRALHPTVLVIVLALAALTAFIPRTGYAEDPVKVTVKVTDSGFVPTTVTISQGQAVELTFEWAHVSRPTEEHIIVIEGYKLESEKIDKAHTTSTVKFIATKVGTFAFSCDIECDIHSSLQNGQLKVTAGGAGSAALTPSKFEIDPVANISVRDDHIIVTATLKGGDGKPIAKADVAFLVEQQFVGTTSLMKVGAARTGPTGIAQLVYLPRETEPEKMVVRFEGLGVYDATEAIIQLPGSQLFGPPSRSTGSGILELKTGARFGLVIVIAAVWGAFAFILYRAWSLRKAQPGGRV